MTPAAALSNTLGTARPRRASSERLQAAEGQALNARLAPAAAPPVLVTHTRVTSPHAPSEPLPAVLAPSRRPAEPNRAP